MSDTTKLRLAAQAAGGVDWKWWDSNSTLRLTTEINGRHGADGDAISAYRDSVQCPEAVRAFIEAANPATVLALIADNERLALFETSHAEWLEKTEWVQKTCHWSELGKHRADVLHSRIDRINMQNERLSGFIVGRRAEAERYDQALAKVAEQRDKLKDEVEAMRKDAQRYLWLRNSSQYDWDVSYGKLEIRIETPYDDASDLDACIDAAMGKGERP